MLIAHWTFSKGCIEMFSLPYNQVLLNLGIIYAKPTITILDYLDTRYFVVYLKFPAHYVRSPRILNGFFSCLGGLIFDEHPAFASPLLILLPYYLDYLPIFLHVVFKVNKRQSSIKSTHIHHPLFLLVVPFNPCHWLILVLFSLLSLFLSCDIVFLTDDIRSDLQTPLEHSLNSFT